MAEKYTISNKGPDKGKILKDGHTMFLFDILNDLNRKTYLEGIQCQLYVNPAKSCQALKDRKKELAETKKLYE